MEFNPFLSKQSSSSEKKDTELQPDNYTEEGTSNLSSQETKPFVEIEETIISKPTQKKRIWLYLVLGVGILASAGILFQYLQNNPEKEEKVIPLAAKLPPTEKGSNEFLWNYSR